jgi:hypothetical protein
MRTGGKINITNSTIAENYAGFKVVELLAELIQKSPMSSLPITLLTITVTIGTSKIIALTK